MVVLSVGDTESDDVSDSRSVDDVLQSTEFSVKQCRHKGHERHATI